MTENIAQRDNATNLYAAKHDFNKSYDEVLKKMGTKPTEYQIKRAKEKKKFVEFLVQEIDFYDKAGMGSSELSNICDFFIHNTPVSLDDIAFLEDKIGTMLVLQQKDLQTIFTQILERVTEKTNDTDKLGNKEMVNKGRSF